jgi:hypothetical protein
MLGIAVFLSSVKKETKNTTFWKLDVFLSSGEGIDTYSA